MAEATGQGDGEKSIWSGYGETKELKGVGLREHEEPTLTDKQAEAAPQRDFRAQLEEAARAKTPSIKVGQMDDDA